MTPVETVLIILVTVGLIIFVVIALGLIFVFFQVKKALDKINYILTKGQDIADDVEEPIRAASSKIVGVVSGAALRTVVELAKAKLGKKS